MYCHGDGQTYGLSTFGARLFELRADRSDAALVATLQRFIAEHAETLGLSHGVSPLDFDLRPTPSFRARAEALTLLRFEQYYRGVPVFGPDARVTLVADHRGALGIRGGIIDPRLDFAHITNPAPSALAHDSILAYAELWTKHPAASLRVENLRLVAIPRARAIGWSAQVSRGLGRVATVVVEADPSVAVLPLLYVSLDSHASLADAAPISALVESPASDVLAPPAELAGVHALLDGSPLLGSQGPDGMYRLATERIVVLDATGKTAKDHELLTMLEEDDGSFTATTGSPRFLAQDAFVALANAYAWTAQFMGGRWESTDPVPEGEVPLTPPGQFEPRLHVLTNLTELPCDGSACFEGMPLDDLPALIPSREHFYQPLGAPGSRWEDMGRILMPGSDPVGGGTWRARLLHEFGHFVDNFAQPGMLDDGFGCLGDIGCQPSCIEDTTDEAAPLKESWAQIASILYLRSLYAVGADPARCDLLPLVSTGQSASPHHGVCRSPDEPFSVLLRSSDPNCPGTDAYLCAPFATDWPACKTQCDKPQLAGWQQDAPGESKPTGLCQLRAGYGTDSLFQALWELLHAQECNLELPYTCETLPALAKVGPELVFGAALHYALRLNTATYRGFFDDIATHIACNAGPAVYDEVHGVLCHHHLRPCDAPVPAACELCGNGVREGEEACDGGDLGGVSCETLGYGGGALACSSTCTHDASPCSDLEPTGEYGDATTGMSDPVPDGATATAGEGSTSDGCGCTSTRTTGGPDALLGAALLAWSRRRRQRAHLSLALWTIASVTLACTDRAPADTGDSSSTGDEGTSTDVLAIDPRFFDRFHHDGAAVGDRNIDPETLYLWSEVEIRGDRTMTYYERKCGDEPFGVIELTWTWDEAAGVLRSSPKLAGQAHLGGCTGAVAELKLGDSCGELWMHVVEPEGCLSGPEVHWRFLPGRLCPEVFEIEGRTPQFGDTCFFEMGWCDDRPLPMCQAP